MHPCGLRRQPLNAVWPRHCRDAERAHASRRLCAKARVRHACCGARQQQTIVHEVLHDAAPTPVTRSAREGAGPKASECSEIDDEPLFPDCRGRLCPIPEIGHATSAWLCSATQPGGRGATAEGDVTKVVGAFSLQICLMATPS